MGRFNFNLAVFLSICCSNREASNPSCHAKSLLLGTPFCPQYFESASLIENKHLFLKDRDAYEDKIKEIFDPMIDFRRVAASVMGKKYYQTSSPQQRKDFVAIFRNSLLDTYAETLAQWGDQSINTIPGEDDWSGLKSMEVKQMLDTGSTKYPISYKLRRSNNQWMIVNIIVNGVNLGLTFRNQFQALANNHNGDIEMILKNWISDAGDAGIDG